ncbi:MAG: HEAT repeat domain-containing protein [Gemmatimonadaceae bacterium]|nr:HEAT repeat domain-containing protein [Gemmatimonadaceae bacterium]
MMSTQRISRGIAVAAMVLGPIAAQAQAAAAAPRARALLHERTSSASAVRSIPWSNDQVTDSVYRLARERMNRGQYQQAAELFLEVVQRVGAKPLAGDALYWSAYSLYRDGGATSLTGALASLDRLSRDFPSAASIGDANALRMRVCGELARRGDAQCAEQVAQSAGGRAASVSAAARARSESRAATRARTRATQEQGCPQDDDDDERIAALNALLQMDADRALPILERVLARRDKCSAALRRKAVFLVSQKGDARAADILMGAVRSDPDPEVREQAVFWLGQTRDERAVDMLQEILQKETDPDVLDKAVFALSQHRSERAGAILRDLAQRDGAPLKVREQAIFWLGQQRSSDNAALLKSLYSRVKEEALKEKIIFSISQNRAADNARWLLDVAVDGKEPVEMRKKALFWAGQSRGVSMEDLAAMFARLDDRELKEQVIFVYSQRRDAAAIDKLLEIARSDKDAELRKKAIFWLGQSRDPRALKFLEELVGR